MANITINDLAENRELDRHAMKTFIGGMGMASSLLFSMWPSVSRAAGGATSGGVQNYVTQLFIETLQINDQDVNIINSDNAQVAQSAGNSSLSPNIFATNPLSTSLPTI